MSEKIEYLKKEIKKTGYPLEIEISSILDRGWTVLNTDSYFDRDDGKLRDIDIRAEKTYDACMPLFLSTSLVVECKKSEDFAWVFLQDRSILTTGILADNIWMSFR